MKSGYKPLRLLATLIVCFATFPADAGALAAALEQAWLRHPQSSTLDARSNEAKAQAEIADALTPGPAALSLAHLNDSLSSNRGKQEWEAELSTPLWLPGQKSAQATEAASIGEEIAARRAALRLELAGEVRIAWWTLATSRQADELAQRRLSSARGLEADVMRRYAAGELSRVDANLARGETLAAQTWSLAAASARHKAETDWRNLTAMAAPAHLPTEALAGWTEPISDHPNLAAMASAMRVANARLRLAQMSQRNAPELALRLLRERGDSNEAFGSAIGIKLTIPFSAGPRQRRDAAAAIAEANRVAAEQQLAIEKLALDTTQARQELDMAEQQWALAQTQRELTADTVSLAERAFNLGESDLTMLLRARAAAFEAEAQLSQLSTARGRAISLFKQALGQMP